MAPAPVLTRYSTVLLTLCLALAGSSVAATALTPGTVLTAPDGVGGDDFGVAVAVDGDRLVVGAQSAGAGAAYVFDPTGPGAWSVTKLTADDGSAAGAGDWFGAAVDVSGDRVVVGAPLHDGAKGAVYVFELVGGVWTQAAKLTATGSALNDRFGDDVAVSGDRVVVGAPNEAGPDTAAGAVYVFDRSGGAWTGHRIVAEGGGTNHHLGSAVGISGGRIVAGAPGYGPPGHSGSVLVLEPDGLGGWTQTRLTASDAAPGDELGSSVAVSGDRIAAGAPADDTGGVDRVGSVYLFEADGSGGWSQVKLEADDAAENDSLGDAVALSGMRVISGAPRDDDDGGNAGSIYLFSPGPGGWTQTRVGPPAGAGGFFGGALAAGPEHVLVGARAAAGGGAAAFFTEPDTDGDGIPNEDDLTWRLGVLRDGLQDLASANPGRKHLEKAIRELDDTLAPGVWEDDTTPATGKTKLFHDLEHAADHLGKDGAASGFLDEIADIGGGAMGAALAGLDAALGDADTDLAGADAAIDGYAGDPKDARKAAKDAAKAARELDEARHDRDGKLAERLADADAALAEGDVRAYLDALDKASKEFEKVRHRIARAEDAIAKALGRLGA